MICQRRSLGFLIYPNMLGITLKEIILIVGTAIITAVLTQGSVAIYELRKARSKRRAIHQLICENLFLIDKLLVKLGKEYAVVEQHIRTTPTKDLIVDTFSNLHADVYKAISLTDLFDVFNQEITLIISIYNSVIYFQDNLPAVCIREIRDKVRLPNGQVFLQHDLEMLRVNCLNNIETIQGTRDLIAEFLRRASKKAT